MTILAINLGSFKLMAFLCASLVYISHSGTAKHCALAHVENNAYIYPSNLLFMISMIFAKLLLAWPPNDNRSMILCIAQCILPPKQRSPLGLK